MGKKRWILVVCVIALVAVAALASSLHDVHFQPGKPLPGNSALYDLPALIQTIDKSVSDVPVWKAILFWAALFIYIVLFLYLLPSELRKRLIRQAFRLAVSVLALYLAFRYHILQFPELNFGSADQAGGPQTGLGAYLDAAPFQPPEMRPWLTYLVSLIATLALLGLTWVAYRWWKRFSSRNYSPLNTIADIAQASLEELAAGREWSDVIVQSYIRMNEAVSARRGLRRAQAMTPREFAERLSHAGLPTDAVRRLTRLFESARYGARQSSQSDVSEAISCLNSILRACGASQ